jgi:transposase
LVSDETGTKIDGKNGYQWAFQNKLLTFFKSSFFRKFQVIEETIGHKFNGSWVSDRYGAQLKIEAEHQLCLPHLVRDCKYIEESENSKWAKRLRKLLENLMRFRKLQGGNFNPFESTTFRIIKKLKKALYRIFSKAPPKKLEKTLFNSLNSRQNQLIHFLDKPDVPYDNNGSERALRNRVIKRKISGGFRSFNGAVCHDIIASVIETAKKQGLNVFQVLTSILSGGQLLLTT